MALSNKTKGHIALWSTSPLWGSTFIAGEIAVREMDPVAHGYFRVILASLFFSVVILIRKRMGVSRRTTPLWKLACTGFCGIAVFHFCHAWQLRLSNATQTAVLVGLLPIALAILGAFFLKEALTIFKVLGLVLAFSGMIVVTNPSSAELLEWSRPWQLLAASLGGALAYAFGIVMIKRFDFKDPPLDVAARATICGTVLFTPFVFGFGLVPHSFFSDLNLLHSPTLMANLYLALFGNVLGYGLYIYALNHVPAGDTGQFIFIEPLWAALFSFIIFGRAIPPQTLAGAVLIFSGVGLGLYHEPFFRWAARLKSSKTTDIPRV